MDAVRQFSAEQGYEVCEPYVCVDDGRSGYTLDRPGLDRLRDGAVAQAFEGVVALCPDRLSRKYAYQVLIIEELERFGVKIIFVKQPPAEDHESRLLVQIQGVIAEYERGKITDRMRRGKIFRARQGDVICWSAPYGYRRVPRRDGVPAHLEIAPAQAAHVRSIFQLHTEDRLTMRQIIKRLAERGIAPPHGRSEWWGTSTIKNILHNEAYSGTFYYNQTERNNGGIQQGHGARHRPPKRRQRPRQEWIAIQVPHIVDRETFQLSQSLHAPNSQFSPRHLKEERYLLRYLVRCGKCGRSLLCASPSHSCHYYRCPKRDIIIARGPQLVCPQQHIRSDELDRFVWSEVCRHLKNPELLLDALQRAGSGEGSEKLALQQANLVNKRIQLLSKERERLLDAYQFGALLPDEFRKRHKAIQDQVAGLKREQDQMEKNQRALEDRGRVLDCLEQLTARISERLDNAPFPVRQEIVRAVVEKVSVQDWRVEVYFKIPLPPSVRTDSETGHFKNTPMSGKFDLRSLHCFRRGL